MNEDFTRIVEEVNFLEKDLYDLLQRQRRMTDVEIKSFRQRLQNIRSAVRRLSDEQEPKGD